MAKAADMRFVPPVDDTKPHPTVAEKALAIIREEKLFAALSDDAALLDIARQAVHEALYQPQRIPDPTDPKKVIIKDSIIVEAARATAARLANKVSRQLAAAMMQDDHIKHVLANAINMLTSSMVTMVNEVSHKVTHAALGDLVVNSFPPSLLEDDEILDKD